MSNLLDWCYIVATFPGWLFIYGRHEAHAPQHSAPREYVMCNTCQQFELPDVPVGTCSNENENKFR